MFLNFSLQLLKRNNNGKKYVQINHHTSNDKIFALLDNVQRDDEEDIEELMNDSDIEFFANDEGIFPDSGNADILTPEASIHIVKDNEKEQWKNLKSKLEEVQFQWRCNISPNIREDWNLVGEVCHQSKESASPLEVYEKVVNLDVLIEFLVTQSNLYSQQNGRHFITNTREMKSFLGTIYVMSVNQLVNIYVVGLSPFYWQQWYSKLFQKGEIPGKLAGSSFCR